MELLLAIVIGALTSGGVFLILQRRSFPLIVGLSLLSYAVNVFLFVAGKLAIDAAPIIDKSATAYTDPLPQALVLTAIVISFGMTAVVLLFALGSYLHSGDDLADRPAAKADQ